MRRSRTLSWALIGTLAAPVAWIAAEAAVSPSPARAECTYVFDGMGGMFPVCWPDGGGSGGDGGGGGGAPDISFEARMERDYPEFCSAADQAPLSWLDSSPRAGALVAAVPDARQRLDQLLVDLDTLKGSDGSGRIRTALEHCETWFLTRADFLARYPQGEADFDQFLRDFGRPASVAELLLADAGLDITPNAAQRDRLLVFLAETWTALGTDVAAFVEGARAEPPADAAP